MQNLNSEEKKLADFACHVCFKKMKREQPQAIDCAWRGIDNEYCPDIMETLREEVKPKNAVLIRPMKKNINHPKNENWWLATCPSCGAECWETELERMMREKGWPLDAMCTECSLKQLEVGNDDGGESK